jgi:diguanylate cyclase (GGDEF)-like protein
MDLDSFKDINDTYGHHVGDRALREVATVLRGGIRPYDICVRYAGDEFIVVLSGCGGEEAERKRLELQTAVDQIAFDARPGKAIPLAISIGAAIFPHDGDSYETLLATADSRMYRDKTRRKRQNGSDPRDSHPRTAAAATSSSTATASLSDVDLKRSAQGIL